MAENKQNKSMKWKKLFLALLTCNIIIFLALIILIFWPVQESEIPTSEEEETQKSSEFVVRTTKNNLNELVNAYLDELLKNTNHQYSILLEDDVHLIGELPAFSTTVPLSVHFEPIVQDNGDVVLKQRSISIGLLELPNKKIMEYMKKYLPTPEWINVNPKDEEIYVAVTQMDIKSNFQVSVEHIDLGANNLAFKLKVPYETLGIELPPEFE
ncbi:DUF2140 family protein [Ornithinibacillus sp. L9]|uniref:DUF2140 family protein n=1 Tax=Ornithinibacillus caprae TaxID=2678566 RepID=A0A6N8FPR2_9BACI|nr:YpmS family protein [Ornithinibacillus caprae]MUK90674.1 DUF2140 family protein [Ornithinibacillus caprae]